jgi:hypothetical protein
MDPSSEGIHESLYQDLSCVLLCYNYQSEASLTNLKTKWIPLLQKHSSKSLQKHGLILVGLNFSLTDKDCQFNHKVALFARGFQLQGRTINYRTLLTPGEPSVQAELENLIKSSI